MDIPPETADALGLARESYRLSLENNEMLKKMDRRYVRGFWFKVVWFIALFVLPLLLLPYFFSTYMNSLGLSGSSTGTAGMSESVNNAQQLLDLLQKNQPNPR